MSTAASLQTLAAKTKPLSTSTHAGLLLQRKCACGSPTSSLTGECAACTSTKRLQTKLTIGASNDPFEQEADRVADMVLTAPANPPVSAAPPHIQRFTGQPIAPAVMVPASVDRVLASPGRPLDPALRQDMEVRFGHDFSRVRVHSDAAAEQSARELNANAYTAGQNIVFGAGRHEPSTHEGRRLIAHELTHVVQQSGSYGTVDSRSDGKRGLPPIPIPTTIQREMKFELQTTNRIWRNDGVNPPSLLDRKYGPRDFLVKSDTGVRLECETDGVLEFETEWFRKWSALENALTEAVAMTKKMNDAPDVKGGRKAFPFDVGHLKKGSSRELRKGVWDWKKGYEGSNEKILGEEERLEVEIVDGTWKAAIQSSESIALTQFGSLLKEHEPSRVERTSSSADEIVSEAAKSAKKSPAEFENLRSFLQIVFYYIERGRTDLKKPGGHEPAKTAFLLMSRTSFSSMFHSLLSEQDKILFREIVSKQSILKKLHLTTADFFFTGGHGGGRGPTIHKWLKSIVSPGEHGHRIEDKKNREVDRDLLSPPKSGSAAMGAFDVEEEKGKKNTNLVRFETRDTYKDFKNIEKVSGSKSIRVQPAEHWVAYAKELFKYAADNRKRPGTEDDPATPENETEKTALIYDADPISTPDFELKLNLKFGDENRRELEIEFRKFLPTLLDGKLQPFVYTGVGSGGLSAGIGTGFDPFADMSLFLTGKGGIRIESFKSIEIGGGAEAGWGFGKNRSLRLGVGWEVWQGLDSEKQRTHLLNVFFGKRF